MQKYLFLIQDRYESSLSESHELKAGLTNPKLVFRNCMIGIVGKGDKEAEEWYDDEVADQVCQKGNFTTYDDEEQSFLLIKLEN
jgi:hypothetical protein